MLTENRIFLCYWLCTDDQVQPKCQSSKTLQWNPTQKLCFFPVKREEEETISMIRSTPLFNRKKGRKG